MRRMVFCFTTLLAARAADFTADSNRGAKLFETLSCIRCHSIMGRGGITAPDLGKIIDRDFTPALLTATLWNHAPKMWAIMQQRDVHAGDLNPQAAADLLAYFYTARFFERPGDAGRGLRLFTEEHCADCHGIKTAAVPGIKPVSQWQAVNSPVSLVDNMWNHAAQMRQEFARRKWSWPDLTSQDLSDILVYLRSSAFLPAGSAPAGTLEITAGDRGKEIFESKTCSGCHHTALELAPRIRHMTLTDIAAALWNHGPKMTAPQPSIAAAEMDDLISFLWARQFFEDAGNASAGRRVFESKRCTGCHASGAEGAPKLPSSSIPMSGPEMISALWHHGPRMMEQMKSKNIRWPQFTAAQMSNLIAYLKSQ